MSTRTEEVAQQAFPEIERALVELARVFHWTGLYQRGHPFLEERSRAVCASVASVAAQEPSGWLLVGVARDRILYREAFLGARHPLIRQFSEALYLRQVATLGIGADCAPEGLAEFFRAIRDPNRREESPEELVGRDGIRGIQVYPHN